MGLCGCWCPCAAWRLIFWVMKWLLHFLVKSQDVFKHLLKIGDDQITRSSSVILSSLTCSSHLAAFVGFTSASNWVYVLVYQNLSANNANVKTPETEVHPLFFYLPQWIHDCVSARWKTDLKSTILQADGLSWIWKLPLIFSCFSSYSKVLWLI